MEEEMLQAEMNLPLPLKQKYRLLCPLGTGTSGFVVAITPHSPTTQPRQEQVMMAMKFLYRDRIPTHRFLPIHSFSYSHTPSHPHSHLG
jgi:hypothetical protein